MSDNRTLPCDVIVKTEVKQEPVDEDENEKSNGMHLKQCPKIKEEEVYATSEVENVAYGAMLNEEVLPDSFPVPVGCPVLIKEDKCEEASLASQTSTIPKSVATNASPGDMAENQTHLPGNSKSGVHINDVSKSLHKKQILTHMGSNPSQEDKNELQFPKGSQNSNFNIQESSSPPCVLSPVSSTFADSISSSTTPLLSAYADSPPSLLTSTQRSHASSGPSVNLALIYYQHLPPVPHLSPPLHHHRHHQQQQQQQQQQQHRTGTGL